MTDMTLPNLCCSIFAFVTGLPDIIRTFFCCFYYIVSIKYAQNFCSYLGMIFIYRLHACMGLW